MKKYNLRSVGVLIVDDQPLIRRILRGICKELGVGRVRTAEGGEHALDLLDREPVDLVFCDMFMQGMDGIELVRRIRAGEEGTSKFTPIVMISAYTERDTIMEARDAGVTEFLAKPISAVEVLKRIVTVIENPRPFIRAQDFFGPDRRRRNVEFYGEDRRMHNPVPA